MQQSRQIYKIDFFHHNKTKLKDRRVRRDSPLSIEREFLLRRRWIVKDRVIFSNILEKGRRVSGTRGGGTGHSVITLMHRPPSISSPHLRLRDNDSLPLSLIAPHQTKKAQSDRSTRRSIESMGQRGSPICLRTNRNCSVPSPPYCPAIDNGNFSQTAPPSPRIFVASLCPDTISRNSREKIRHRSVLFLFSSFLLEEGTNRFIVRFKFE